MTENSLVKRSAARLPGSGGRPVAAFLVTITAVAIAMGAVGGPASAGLARAATRALTSSGPTINATEGQMFSGQLATASCPPTAPPPTSASFTINWGDGNSSAGSAQISGQDIAISGMHTYPEESPDGGIFTIGVSGTYDCGTTPQNFSTGLSAVVADAPLSETITLSGAFAGRRFSGQVATFADADPGGTTSDYSATINWGDGTSGSGTIAATKAGFAVLGSHTYSSGGNDTLSVTVNDAGGASVTRSGTVAVTPPASARFTAPKSVTAGGIALLNATGSHPNGQVVTGFKWILTGPGVLGGSASATCAGYTSDLQTSFDRRGPVTATLEVEYASGAVSKTSHRLAVRSARENPIASWANGHTGQWFLCDKASIDADIQATNNGGPPKGCQDQYIDFQVKAIGCFTVLDNRNEIPKPEYNLLCPYFFKLDLCNPVIYVPGLGANPMDSRAAGVPAAPEISARIPTPLPPVISYFGVRVNGVDITPDSGAAFVLDMSDGAMASSSAELSLLDGKLPLKDGRLITSTFNVNGDLPLFDGDLDQILASHPALRTLLDAAGFLNFKIGGRLTVQLVPFASKISATLTLPDSFTNPNDNNSPVTSTLTATADNTNGLVIDDLFVKVPSANFAKTLSYDNLTFCYQHHISEGFCQDKTGADFAGADGSSSSSWNATLDVNLLGTDVDAVPPPPDNGIGFVDGNFAFAGFTAHDLHIPIGHTGVVLEDIGAGFGQDPTRFNGQIGISALHLVKIDGCVFMVFANQDQPYTFTGTELGDCGVTLPTRTTQGLGVAVGGDVSLTLPFVGDQKLASGYVLFTSDPGYLAAGGNIHFDPLNGALVLDGGVSGQFALDGSNQFDVEGHLHVHALFIDLDADGVLSSKGVGVCGSVKVLWATVSAGAGYQWGQGVNAWIGSCDLSPYRVTGISNARLRPGIPAAGFTLPAGLPSEMVKVVGKGGAPDITIGGPGGITASTNGGTQAEVKPFAIFRVASQHTTYIAIIRPPKGRYTITANSGSPAITKVMNADGLTPAVSAHLTHGRGGKLVLHFTDRQHAGQRVVFAEQAKGVDHIIGSSQAAHGTLEFRPAPGPGGKRQIVAQILQDGAPVVLRPGARTGASLVVVSSYRASGPRLLARVSHLTIQHSGTHVHIRWTAVRGALGYLVTIEPSSGQHEVFRVSRTRLTVGGVFGEFGGKVLVQAVGDNVHARSGPAASIRFRKDQGD